MVDFGFVTDSNSLLLQQCSQETRDSRKMNVVITIVFSQWNIHQSLSTSLLSLVTIGLLRCSVLLTDETVRDFRSKRSLSKNSNALQWNCIGFILKQNTDVVSAVACSFERTFWHHLAIENESKSEQLRDQGNRRLACASPQGGGH